jgi:hypothetical protein
MNMKRLFGLALVALCGLSSGVAQAHGFWSVGVRIGVPLYPPWCGCGYYYYRPYPVYVAPPPVYVAPAPVVVQPAPTVVQPAPAAPAASQALPARPEPVQARYAEDWRSEVERHIRQLSDPDERVRLDSVQQLGRLKATRAIDPLAATLAGDPSAAVRDAAARALGLIGSPRCLPALNQAARIDRDRDVRHTAQFAIEVIQSR